MADRAPRSPPVFRTSSSHSGVVEAPTSRPAESAVREVRKHLLVRIRLRHSAGQVTLAPPFVAVEELVQRLPQLPVQPRRLVRCVGKISSEITADTPRLFRNFNFRCVWSDGWTNNMLTLEQYASGPSAAYGSWVILEKGSE